MSSVLLYWKIETFYGFSFEVTFLYSFHELYGEFCRSGPSLLLSEMISAEICWSIYHHISTVLSPYLVKLVKFDIILVVRFFWGNLSAQ